METAICQDAKCVQPYIMVSGEAVSAYLMVNG